MELVNAEALANRQRLFELLGDPVEIRYAPHLLSEVLRQGL